MSNWEGFTEEDLSKIKGDKQAKKKDPVAKKSANSRVISSLKPVADVAKSEISQGEASVIPAKPLSQVVPIQKQSPAATLETPVPTSQPPELTEISCTKYLSGIPSIIQKKENKLSAAVEPVVRERLSLDEFELRRKVIEEQNRQKKDTLSKALLERRQKTAEEAQKLHQIQEELQRLDAQLGSEVAILRKHIESASFILTDAQKRYEKAEVEFIEAKKELYDKREKKELLTEHLCTIIEQNEVRKANKLSELLRQLDDTVGEYEVYIPSLRDEPSPTEEVIRD